MSVAAQLEVKITPAIPHALSRPFVSYPGSNYVLPSDQEEKDRLALQHKVVKIANGGKILLAPISFQPGDKVLDSGTGPAVWLLEFAKSVPASVELYGIDIEAKAFPPEDSIASNMHFSVASILSVPEDWSNQFTLVHQRFLLAALQQRDWPIVMKEFYRVVAPGGWVQLCEASDWQSGPVNERLIALRAALDNHRGLFRDCAKEFPSMFKEAGFINIKSIDRSAPLGKWAGQHGEDARDNISSLYKAMKMPVLNAGGFSIVNSEEEYDSLIDEAMKEFDGTIGSQIHYFTCWAQKPRSG